MYRKQVLISQVNRIYNCSQVICVQREEPQFGIEANMYWESENKIKDMMKVTIVWVNLKIIRYVYESRIIPLYVVLNDVIIQHDLKNTQNHELS